MKSYSTILVATFAVVSLTLTGCGNSKKAKAFHVGLIPDVGHIDDNTFNGFADQGAREAANDASLNVQYDYAKPQCTTADLATSDPTKCAGPWGDVIDAFAKQNYDMMVSVGYLMADITLAKAKQYPKIQFAIVDNSYAAPPYSLTGSAYPSNLTGIIFREDQAGYLAGIVAAGMVAGQSAPHLGCLGGPEVVPAVPKYCNGFANAVKANCPSCTVDFVYVGFNNGGFSPQPDANVSGKDNDQVAADTLIGDGDTIIFGVGGAMGSAGIAYAAQQSAVKYVIGVDQDEWFTTFQAGNAPGADKLLTSAMKRVDVSVYESIKNAVDGKLTGGDMLFNAANQGVGIAPYHSNDAKVSAAVKTQVKDTLAQLAAGTLSTGVNTATGAECCIGGTTALGDTCSPNDGASCGK